MDYLYEIALSFAGEDRGLVEGIATRLRRRRVKVFYDGFERALLWGKDLYQHLFDVYSGIHPVFRIHSHLRNLCDIFF
jgi:hypothetical protein